MKKTRFVLMYDFMFEVGGLEKLMATHAQFLKQAGYDVILLFGSINKEIVNHKTFDGLKIEEYGTLKSNSFLKLLAGIFGINRLKQLIRKEDILVSYSFPVNYTLRNFKNKKIQYLNHFPNFLYLPLKEKIVWANNPIRKIAVASSILAGPIIERIDKKLVRKNALIFENSEFTKKRLDPIYGVNGIVSYPPIISDFKPIKDKTLLSKYRINQKFLFASGRIIPDKRFDWLIRAFSLIKNKSVKLYISGQCKEKYKEQLMNMAKKLNLEKRIEFLGVIPKEDLVKFYSLAETYVFPAPQEDFGLVPAEAISCGTPCIVWNDNAGPSEQIKDNINGFLAKPYSLKDFANKIDLSLSKNWNEKEIINSSKKFSEKTIIHEYNRLIKSILNN